MAKNKSAIVIGGGVIGCATAYYLRQQGWDVRILEARQIGRGCSHGNCGFICPSHVLPLTIPGAIWPVMRRMFRRDSAIYVKPRWDPALWRWFMRFALGCRERHVMGRAAARHALLASSMKLYRQLIADESLDVEWDDRGLLLVFKSPHEFEGYERVAALVRDEFGVVASPYDGKQLTMLEPALRSGPAGGWHYPGDAHLRPDRLMAELKSRLASRGVDIAEGVKITHFTIENGRARSIDTTAGAMSADQFVLATGAEAAVFAKQLGCRIPIQPGKGYSITMRRSGALPSIPIILEEFHVAVTPWASGLRIGSTMEFVGYDTQINRRRIDLFQRAVAEYLIDPPTGPIEEEWCGWRPMTYDDLPCIGHAPGAANVVIAAGHGMIGMATAPASGKLAAELISGESPHVDPGPYSLRRFGQ
ncbi:MAG TPA: FAD-dependent oxidoreductase [Lacipirellulaceae bacterium]|nr:FAD-dependent oxidoreductase [Lacipirellulaceae bacterium]